MQTTKTILFNPGPVMVSQRVRNSLAKDDICHRGPEFMELFADTVAKINKLFKADDSYQSVIISGSGTSSNETVLSSIFKPEDAVLLITNGVFGERLEEIIDKHQVKKYVARFDWGQQVDTAVVEEMLASHPEITTVAMVYHETSTAMINKVKEVGTIAKKMGKIYFVDAISAGAGEDIDVIDQQIDIITSVGGKALGAYPGSAYICARKEILDNLEADNCKTVYLNLYKHYQIAIKNNQTPNTPNVTLFFALNEALTEYLEDPSAKLNRYVECSTMLREGLKKMGLKFYLPEDEMSNTVTSVLMPKHIDVLAFIDALEEQERYVVYSGKGVLLEEHNMLQVANMGEIYPSDCEKFLVAFERLLSKY